MTEPEPAPATPPPDPRLDAALDRLEALADRLEAVLGRPGQTEDLLALIVATLRDQSEVTGQLVEIQRRAHDDDRPEWLREHDGEID